MTALKCDVCGRFYEDPASSDSIELFEDQTKVDLCPNCYRKIYNILHRPKKQHAKVVEYETPELNGGFVFR